MNAPMTGLHTCACGCGETPRRRTSRYLPGHHKQRRDPLADRYVVDEQGCWVWQGYRLPGGYGQLTYRRDSWLAHRLSYYRHYGELPAGELQIHHICANRACLNPDHLEAVTPIENRRAAPTKLDPAKAEQIRALSGDMSQGEIAARFGVDRTMVGKVLREEVWREEPAA
ncbi:MAG: HNH endonuclease [Chloroflexota bacterium]|nr:HNH endonuclease [Chloroflexota bacterium]